MKLFLDLDGVLADFDGFLERVLGIVSDRNQERPDFWDTLRAYKGRLYFDMEPFPRAKEMFKALREFNPTILTGVPKSIPRAYEDKVEWVKKHIDPEVAVIGCKSWEKFKYGSPGDILVDDWNKYQTNWEKMGGIFILHKNVDDSVAQVRNLYARA